METLKNYKQIMKDQTTVALATSVGNTPNVRIVNFIMKEDSQGLIYFASFKGNKKNKEFEENNRISFTTIPNENTGNIRVHSAIVKRSELSINDLADDFVQRIPEYKEIIDVAAGALEIFEIHYNKATVILDYANIAEVEL